MLPFKHQSTSFVHIIFDYNCSPCEDLRHSIFVMTHVTFLTMANEMGPVCYMLSLTVITPAVSQVSLSSAVILLWFFCLFDFVYVDCSWNSHICLSHHVSSVKIDPLTSHFTTVDWPGIIHFQHNFFCVSDQSFTHAFMQFYFAQLQLQKTQYLQLGQNRGQYYGGSLPNVNQIGNGNIDLPFQVSP